jgi:hypothetical protein
MPDHISASLETILWVKLLKCFVADPDPVSSAPRPEIEKFGSGMQILDPSFFRQTVARNAQDTNISLAMRYI